MKKIAFIMLVVSVSLQASEHFMTLAVTEPIGMDRQQEYIQVRAQTELEKELFSSKVLMAVTKNPADTMLCQILDQTYDSANGLVDFNILFPLSMQGDEQKRVRLFWISSLDFIDMPQTSLRLNGNALSFQVENRFYKAFVGQIYDDKGVKRYLSGQLGELLIKSGIDQKLFRSKNMMHWAPNARRCGVRRYKTLAHWDPPAYAGLETGPYCIETRRYGAMTDYPEISVSARYAFFAFKPYFIFFSVMNVDKGICIQRLRNDEMTMDSLFTHVAFERSNGTIVNLSFEERYAHLKTNPIRNQAPWLAFYHAEKGYGFGSIRLQYSVLDCYGEPSPLAFPHTRISDGAGGGKYWNRYLICDQQTFVPSGSRYMEKNAYLVFTFDQDNPLNQIRHYARLLRHPLQIEILQPTRDFSGRR